MSFSPEALIVLGPLFAAAFAGLLQRYIGDKVAMGITTASVGVSLILSWPIFLGFVWGDEHARLIELFTFIDVGGFTSTWSVRIDTLSAIMLVVVNTVSFLVHVYSIAYMAEDPHRARFFSYLSFFTFAMLALVTANDFLQLFFGWEGVGVASYLLIGFWFQKRSANDAAIKAFITNRVGDFGFALGIMAAFMAYGSIRYDGVFAAAAANPDLMFNFGALHLPVIETVAFLLFIGAMGKSAQFFLHVWLPDAMEGPTPVSALIHAATMVTAGVFMVCRLGELFEMAPLASGFVTVVGAMTALFAATVGVAQNDIKRVVAYSTCSQLGYMFFAAGVGAYNAAMFHLFTHAFFKALLFLGAGSVIHGLHHEQDMRYMGGVRKPMPITWAMMTIGTLALIGFGIPGIGGFAGFYSKDAIIEAAYGSHGIGAQFAFWCGVSAALLTSFYSWRLAFMTFEGLYRGNPNAHHDDHAHAAHDDHAHDDHHSHAHDKPADGSAPAHESPWIMLGPLVVLATGAVLAGVIFAPYFLGEHAEGFWRHVVPLHHGEHDFPAWVIWAPLIVTVTGFLIAVVFYLFNTGAAKAMAKGPVWAFLYNKWYFDELYDFIFVKGARAIGDLFWKVGDARVIDGLGPDGFAATSRFLSRQLRRVQTGFVYHYSFIMLIAAVAFGAYAIFAGIGERPMSEMFAGWPLLSIITFLPAAGAALILLSRMSLRGVDPGYDSGVRLLTLVITSATFLVSLVAFAAFDPSQAGYQMSENVPWAFGISYAMGVDSLSVSLVLLTTFLTPLCILASWSIERQVSSYMVLFLLLETLMIGVFCAQDIVLFYIFFEGGLIPMFILIGVWGGQRRVYAAFKFFLYTLLGSLLMLVAIVAMISIAGTASIEGLTAYAQSTGFSYNLQLFMWLAFFASFAVKMPMWPVHTWLPDAHVEAPTAGSVVLAAILLKMGGYGFLRFSLPMFPEASHFFTPLVFALSVIAIVWASLVAFRQLDMKKLIAYSSVAHMGFVTMGIFAGTIQGIQGAIFQMLSHGIISGALFLCVGVVYDRMHTREIAFYGGLVNRMPVYAAIFMLFTLGNVGLPGTSGFPGEILTMVGTFQVNAWVAAGACLGVIFSASYALTLYRKVAFGVIENPKLDGIADLDAREWMTFIPLIIATLVMGLAPGYVLDFTHSSAESIAAAFATGATP